MSIKISKKLVCDAIMQLAQDEERWITIGAGPVKFRIIYYLDTPR